MGDRMKHPRPRLVVSKCLGFESCRYDGQMSECSAVEELKPFVAFIPVCPEVGGGLGIPRKEIRVVASKGGPRLVEPETGKDRTQLISRFLVRFMSTLKDIDGFILKSRSPSCALRDAKLYRRAGDAGHIGHGPGLFGQRVLKTFSHLALCDESSLHDGSARESFLTKLFTLARFRAAKMEGTMDGLSRFHAENRLLFIAHNQRKTKVLDRILASGGRGSLSDLVGRYEVGLRGVLVRAPTRASNIKILRLSFKRFESLVGPGEKLRFLKLLDGFRLGEEGVAAPREMMRSWIARFRDESLAGQTYFEPYPHELVKQCV